MEMSVADSKHKTRAFTQKPKTRLQEHAPASLQLDGFVGNSNADPHVSSGAIPLLSPLILTPPHSPVEGLGQLQLSGYNTQGVGEQKGEILAKGGCEHPAVVSSPEALFALFQGQCKIANHVQGGSDSVLSLHSRPL